MSYYNNITEQFFCQDKFELQQETLQKLSKHKSNHIKILDKLIQGKREKSEAIKQRLKECASFVTFADNLIINANFCKDKFCPVCAWRRSLKNYSINFKTLNHITETNQCDKFAMLTLTIKNVKAEEVKTAVEHLQYAIKKLQLQTKWKKHIQGAIKSVEITYNSKENTYHPHVHLIIAFKKDYFIENYISQAEFTTMWQNALKSDYTPIVDIRAIKPKKDKKGTESMAGAVAEISKYPLKISSMLETVTGDDFFRIYDALEHKRLLSRSGIFKTAIKELGINEKKEILVDELPDGAEIEHVTNENGEVIKTRVKYNNSKDFIWKTGGYQLYKPKE